MRHVDRSRDIRSKWTSRQHLYTLTQNMSLEKYYTVQNTKSATLLHQFHESLSAWQLVIECIMWPASTWFSDVKVSNHLCEILLTLLVYEFQQPIHDPLPVTTFRVSKKSRFCKYVTNKSMSFELFGKVRWNTQWEAHQWRNSADASDQASWPVNDSYVIDNQV